MIKALEGPKHFDLRLYGLQKLAHEIEAAFKAHLHTDAVYYYFASCPYRHKSESCGMQKHRLIWHGPGLIGFIRNTQKISLREGNAPVLYATSAMKKGTVQSLYDELDRLIDEDIFGEIRYNAAGHSVTYKEICDIEERLEEIMYWIGDVDRKAQMMCCDRLFGILWDELKQ